MCLSPSGPLSSCLWTWKAVADFWLTKHACLELLVLFTKSRCEHTLGVIFNQDVSGKWKFLRKKQDPRSSKKVDDILIFTIPLGGYTQKVFSWAVLGDEQMKEMDDNFSYQMASKWATRWGWFTPTSSLVCSFSIHFCLGKISILTDILFCKWVETIN